MNCTPDSFLRWTSVHSKLQWDLSAAVGFVIKDKMNFMDRRGETGLLQRRRFELLPAQQTKEIIFK